MIGDSFAQGACVGNGNTIIDHLTTRGGATLNLATGGNTPTHYAALAKTFIPKFKPKYVTIIFYPNYNIEDNKDNVYYKYFFEEDGIYFYDQKTNPNSLIPSENLKAVYANLLDRMTTFANGRMNGGIEQQGCNESFGAISLKYLILRFKLATFQSLIKMSFLEKSSFQDRLPFGSMLALDTVKNYCETYSCSVEIVHIPNSLFWRPDYRAERYKELRQYSEIKNLKFIDSSSELKTLGRNAYAIKGPHLSPAGYKAVADSINNSRF